MNNRNLKNGILGGLAGGAVFGMMMAMTGLAGASSPRTSRGCVGCEMDGR